MKYNEPFDPLTAGESRYYANTAKKIGLASRISFHTRKKIFRLFMSAMRPSETMNVVDIGVTSDNRYRESNFFEQFYPHKERVTCAGVEDASYLEELYPGIRFIAVTPDHPLPFADSQFDIAFSNAVVEHAGGEEAQRFFVAEVLRVSRAFFVTTPNRWFPVELHTALPILHYPPKPMYRRVLQRLGLGYWSSEEHLNLLDARGFGRLFPPQSSVRIRPVHLLGLVSNLIAYGLSVPTPEQSLHAGRSGITDGSGIPCGYLTANRL